ncbi:UDP-N-acetylmuramate--L-alanine ligase [Candidatus Dependentiae bacterium]|nr:UDP-N-acetylmuramate--L-alanine ligase [Candidatus Dependentiae bacterium]
MYKKGHIHFVGIGGIGMSGIAKILKYQGYAISGCDLDLEQKSVQELLSLGCSVFKGNNTDQCNHPSVDVLVYSSAIKADNQEIKNAQARGIPTIPRALMLSELMRTKYSIAITGAHGKTTTTSMVAHLLIEADQDPTVIVGGHFKNISTNARWGTGDFLVAEADESDRSLLRLYPTLAVVTNIDLEHLDTYTDINDIKQTFNQFLTNIPFYGKAIVCVDDMHILSLLPLPHVKTIKYGFDPRVADIYAQDVCLEKDHSTFNVYSNKAPGTDNPSEPVLLGSVYLAMPGRYNVLNSLAALAVALDLNIPFEVLAKAFKSFKGVEKRFSFKGIYKGTEIFDDYGHHPTEIFNTLLVARKRADKKLIVVFQPQRYTRTDKLWQEFLNVFAYGPIDQLIITDIHGASETPLPGITSQNLVTALKQKQPSCNVTYVPYDANLEALCQELKLIISEGDLLLLLGAGKIDKLAELLQNS